MGGVVDEPVEPDAQVLQPVQLAPGDRLRTRRRRRPRSRGPSRSSRQNGASAMASAQSGSGLRSTSRPRAVVDRRRPLLAGDARRALPWPAPSRVRRLRPVVPIDATQRARGGARAWRRRGSMTRGSAGPATVGLDELAQVPAAEPLDPLEVAAERDVEHVLGDDRVEHRRLGPGADHADRAAADVHGGTEPHVDDVARRQAHRSATDGERVSVDDRVDGLEVRNPAAVEESPGDARAGSPGRAARPGRARPSVTVRTGRGAGPEQRAGEPGSPAGAGRHRARAGRRPRIRQRESRRPSSRARPRPRGHHRARRRPR